MKKTFFFLLLTICTISLRAQVISICLQSDCYLGAYVKVVSSSPTPPTDVWIDMGSGYITCSTVVTCLDQDGVDWDFLMTTGQHFTGPNAPIPCYTVYYGDGSLLPPAAPSVTACLCPVTPRSSCFNLTKDGKYYEVLLVFDPIAFYLAGGWAGHYPGQVTVFDGSTYGKICYTTPDPDGVDYDIMLNIPVSYGTANPCLSISYTLTQLTDGVVGSGGPDDPLNWPTTYSTNVCPCCAQKGFSFGATESTNSGFDGSLSLPPYTETFTSGGESSWTFGDGTTGVGTSVTHTYPGPGAYTVCAHSTNADSTTCDSCFTFCLTNPNITESNGGDPACHSDFIASVTGAQVNLGMLVSLTSPYYFRIDFGDGTVITNTSGVASHTYTTSGIYTICVSELGGQYGGCTSCEDICVLVGPPPCCDPGGRSSNNTTPASADAMLLAPNPADNSTNLTLTLDKTADVKLTIVDEVGRVVSELTYDQMPGGLHSIELNTAILYPGVYLLSVQTNEGITTKRFSVIR